MLIKQITFLFLCALLSFSCDAPKNNPLHSGTDIIPIVTEYNVYSIVQNRYTLSKIYQVVVQAKITDRNDMIDSVFIEVPYFKAKKNLSFNSQEHFFEATLSLKDLRTTKPDELVGQDFHLIIKDIASRLFEGKSESIKRFIKEDIVIDRPLGGDTTTGNPILEWKKFEGEFTHNFFVQVYTYEITPQLVWQKNGISSDSLSVRVDEPLPKGEYVWYLWSIDQFNNRACSKPATFKVQ